MNPKVSILMSIYNETESEILESINSLITQTYCNVEIIVIVDNPLERGKYEEILKPYAANNDIIVYFNERNIGLARSMNVAVDRSSGEFIARMDADDISVLNRIEKEVACIKEQQADFVCTGYKFIDETGKEIKGKYIHYSPERLKRSLITTNCIHHPTVLMKKEVFVKSGGYRDFPCAQDYDLWLRLLELDCKFYMIDEKLLLHRIRNNSTTNRRRFEQACTLFYISNLCYQRLSTGIDNFSKENYSSFMKECDVKYSTYKRNIMSIQKMQKKIGHGILVTIVMRIRLLIVSNFVRDTYCFKLKLKWEAAKHFSGFSNKRQNGHHL